MCKSVVEVAYIHVFMKRSEKPEGYRQMRPKTFPASNYTGSSQQMLQEIRESLRNLPKPSDAAKADHSLGKMLSEDPRQGRNPPKFLTYHKVLQEIRNSLLPFANEATSAVKGTSEVNQQMLQDLQAAGFDEVKCFILKIWCSAIYKLVVHVGGGVGQGMFEQHAKQKASSKSGRFLIRR